ncbi:MAG: hypothetical protein Q7S86_01500, partial [bacterium]|nr:hypothetical protein [bacterium]
LTLNATGAWTGTFDGQEGTYYLDARNLTNFGSPFYSFFSATNTDALAEGSSISRRYWASTTADTWYSSADRFSTTSANYYMNASNTVPTMYKANTFTALNTFTNSSSTLSTATTFWSTLANIASGIFTNATTTNLGVNSETFTDLTGAGLQNTNGVLTLNATGDWTGTFDGQEGTYYLDARNLTNFGSPFYSFFSATNTDALTQGSLNKYYSTLLFATDLSGTTTTALAEGSNLYYTLSRFASALAGTTTDALSEGTTNKYYTDTRVATVIAGTTTTALAEGTNKYWTDTRFDARLSATTTLPNLTTLLGLTNASTTGLTVTGNSYFGTTTITNLSVTNLSTSTFAGGLTVGTSQFVVQQATGNVGIGTTTPNNLLSVYQLIDFNNTDWNTKIGYQAGKNIVTGAWDNTFIGYQAGFSSSTASTNEAVDNTALGYQSFYSNTTGSSNTAVGNYALYSNTGGTNNTATGLSALDANVGGYNNTANGMYASRYNTTGFYNTALGYAALSANTTGAYNTAIGMNALLNVNPSIANTGYNTAIGYNTGLGITTGTSNTILGANVVGLAPTLSNNIIIADGAGNRRINVGSTGNVGIGTTTPSTLIYPYGMTNSKILAIQAEALSNRTAIIQLIGSSAAAGYANALGRISFVDDVSNTEATHISSYLTTEGTNQGNLEFGTAGSPRLLIDSTGNVGIGTTTPLTLLSLFKTSADSSILLTVGGTATSSWTMGTDYSDGGKFKISSSTLLGTNDRFTIDGNGNVGIGTTSPWSLLSLKGSSGAQMTISQADTNYTQLTVDSLGNLTITPSGDTITIPDDNFKVCAAGNCQTASFTGNGNVLIENNIEIGGVYTRTCDAGYIWVPGSARQGTLPGFCVMKYEAKNDGSNNAVSNPTAAPYVSIDQPTSKTKCEAVGLGYHLISEPEWMTIADNIASTPINDTDTDTNLQLATGHSANTPASALAGTAGADPVVSTCNLSADMENAANDYTSTCQIRGSGAGGSTDADKGYYGTGQVWSATGYVSGGDNKSQLRTHVLSNGNVIWDIAGNVWEWTDAYVNGTAEKPTPVVDAWTEYPNITNYLGLNYARPQNISASSTYGFGQYYGGTTAGQRGFLRGGGWSSGAGSGVFTLNLGNAPSYVYTSVGFRCSR